MANTHSIDFEDSSSQYLFITDASQTGLDITGDLTIECWVKLESSPTDGNDFVFVGKNGAAGDRQYYFYYHNTSGTFSLRFVNSANGTTSTIGSVNQTLTTGTWYHIACVYTAAAGSVEFFVNGSSIGSAGSLNTSIFAAAGQFQISGRWTGAAAEAFMDGKMDDVRVWSVARTSTQIANNRNIELFGNETSLVGYWKLNNSLLDETSNNNDLTDSGSAVFSNTDTPFSTIAIDSVTSNEATATTTHTFAHDSGSGSNRVLIVGITHRSGATAISSVTYNGVAMTLKDSQASSGDKVSIYYLVAPATGSNNVVITYGASVTFSIAGAITFSGGHQTDPVPTVAKAGAATVNITTAYDNSMLVDTFNDDDGDGTVVAGTGQTQRWHVNNGATIHQGAGSTEPTSTAGSYTMSWTSGGANPAIVTVEVRGVAATTATNNNLLLLNVG